MARAKYFNPRPKPHWRVEKEDKTEEYSPRKIKVPKIPPYGIKIWMREAIRINEIGWSYTQSAPTMTVGFPSKNIEPILGGRYQKKTNTLYWSFFQKKNIPLYCILDLLDRLIDCKYWEKDYQIVPIEWRIGNLKALEFANSQIDLINWGKYRDRRLFYPPDSENFADWRHNKTPYDYEWQTEKFSRDEALDFWRRIFTPQP